MHLLAIAELNKVDFESEASSLLCEAVLMFIKAHTNTFVHTVDSIVILRFDD